MRIAALLGAASLLAAAALAPASSTASPATPAVAADRDCADFRNQRRAQAFFRAHDPARDPHGLDADHDGTACERLRCPCRADGFDNGEWVVQKGEGAEIPEQRFKARVDGTPIGNARLLTFASRIGPSRFPQVLVIASSGYLRVKSGADPEPPLPFGQSLVLGPAIFGSSASHPGSTLFFNPQLRRVDVDTGALRRSGKGALRIDVAARGRGLPAESVHTNQIMDLEWEIALREPTRARTRIRVDGEFEFTEQVTPDAIRAAAFESFRLLQISSMFIDGERHDVDGFRYRDAGGPVTVSYSAGQAGALLPAGPTALARGSPIVDSVHTDDAGEPNGNTPSYRISVGKTTGPISGPLTSRVFFTGSQDLNDDNLGLWIHQQPAGVIAAGTRGTIPFDLTATADPQPAP